MTHARSSLALILLFSALAAPASGEQDSPSAGVPWNVEWPADAAGNRRLSSEHTLVRVAVEPASAFAEVGKPLAVKVLACNHTSLPLPISPRELARHTQVTDAAGRPVEPTGKPALPPAAADHELATDQALEVSLTLSHLTIARPGVYRVQYRRLVENGKDHVSWEGVV